MHPESFAQIWLAKELLEPLVTVPPPEARPAGLLVAKLVAGVDDAVVAERESALSRDSEPLPATWLPDPPPGLNSLWTALTEPAAPLECAAADREPVEV